MGRETWFWCWVCPGTQRQSPAFLGEGVWLNHVKYDKIIHSEPSKVLHQDPPTHPLQAQLDLLGTERSKIILTKGTPSYSGAESQGRGGWWAQLLLALRLHEQRGVQRRKAGEVHVYLWREFSAIVAEAAARSPERDINILITMKCTRPAEASNF